MNRPSWFIAALLGFLGSIVATQLSITAMAVLGCREYGRQLRERLERVPVGSNEAQRVIDNLKDTVIVCQSYQNILQDLGNNYLDTTLALLGGAGIVAGASMGTGRNERRQLRRTDSPSASITGNDDQHKNPDQQ